MATPPLKRILIIEDEPDIQAIAQLALEVIGGFSVGVCSSGREGLATAPTFAPDLILLDVMMPGMDGPTTLKALRAIPATAAIPVMFMTAKVQPQEVERYKELGALDVIPKPFDPMSLPVAISAIWERYQARPADAAQEQLNNLRTSYAASLHEKIAQIEAAWGRLAYDAWDDETAQTLHRMAHGLAGSGATFGFPTLSEQAHTLEQLLKQIIERTAPPTAEQYTQVNLGFAALKQAYSESDRDTTSAARSPLRPFAPPQGELRSGQATIPLSPPNRGGAGGGLSPVAGRRTSVLNKDDNRLIFLVMDDPDLAQDLALQIGYFGYTVHTFVGINGLAEMIPQTTLTPIVMDAILLESAGAEVLAEIWRSYETAPPLIFISARDDLATRLRAVRAGGNAYFTMPISIGALIDKLDTLTERHEQEPYRILIVDDEAELAEYHALGLDRAIMTTTVVTDPLQVLRALVEFMPDLILMDMYMPGCNGLELAAVIRQQEAYVGIPIVFLSTEANLDMQLEAMHIGGDDFLTKPIQPDQLISAVTSRVRRSHILRSFMVRDSLTGLLKHTIIKERLDIEVSRARRQDARLVFAMLDIDHFKSVNDTYGHAAGDRVIKSLSRLLQQRLRKTDVIGRYGGEEFAIILPDTDSAGAARVLDELRSGFARIRQQSSGAAFYTTFSCGIAEFPHYGDAISLNDAADRALYAAKNNGRNRVALASEL